MGFNKKRLIIIGLPYFSERLATEINSHGQELKAIALNTYYSKWDQIRSLFLIPFCDSVLSINGVNTKSKVIDYVIKCKKKLTMMWVGTDVQECIKAKKQGIDLSHYLSYASHLCEVEWIAEQLKELDLKPKVKNFVSFDQHYFETNYTDPTQALKVLVYLGSGKESFYGYDWIEKAAISFPEMEIEVVGSDGTFCKEAPSNIHFNGWVSDMDSFFAQSDLVLRIPETDGLSSVVLESLARSKKVIYRFPFEHCIYTPDYDTFINEIRTLISLKKAGHSMDNIEGQEYIRKYFNRSYILTQLLKEVV